MSAEPDEHNARSEQALDADRVEIKVEEDEEAAEDAVDLPPIPSSSPVPPDVQSRVILEDQSGESTENELNGSSFQGYGKVKQENGDEAEALVASPLRTAVTHADSPDESISNPDDTPSLRVRYDNGHDKERADAA